MLQSKIREWKNAETMTESVFPSVTFPLSPRNKDGPTGESTFGFLSEFHHHQPKSCNKWNSQLIVGWYFAHRNNEIYTCCFTQISQTTMNLSDILRGHDKIQHNPSPDSWDRLVDKMQRSCGYVSKAKVESIKRFHFLYPWQCISQWFVGTWWSSPLVVKPVFGVMIPFNMGFCWGGKPTTLITNNL